MIVAELLLGHLPGAPEKETGSRSACVVKSVVVAGAVDSEEYSDSTGPGDARPAQ